ncbi:hypothetical protein FHU41_000746 [Psychromicrobium silvestre]|uniref:DUF1648 domain-containing protein n=1 Tax=Psychromicrobium silvestre TaxID=1645614 RepID=A0A7Y9LS14_9MICC|nr:hypothetical protein [Psychromicrobium silvestre]NYE94525.1 hypothetical protein [Psychromicrobium silvestre]
MKEQRFDHRFLAFGIGFPWAVAFCFAAIALLLRRTVPDSLGLHWQGSHPDLLLTFPAFVLVATLAIGVFGSMCGALGGARLAQRWLRRLLMGLAVMISLLLASLGAAFLMGQRGLPSAEGGSLDATVFALGAGAAVALGVVMMFVYQPTPIWGTRDDLALAEEHAALIGQPRIDFGVHARGSSFVLLTMMLLLLGGLLLIVSSWAALALAVLILLLMGSLFVRVSIDGSAVEERFLVLRVAGFLPVAKYRLAELHAVEAVPSDPWQQGGPGLRRHAGYWQFIVRKGTALRLDFGPRAGLLIGTRDEEQVAELIAYLRASQE